MAPVADRTEGANIGSLTDGSVGRARRRHKKTEGGRERGRGRGGERALCPLGGALGRETSRSFFGARGRRAPK